MVLNLVTVWFEKIEQIITKSTLPFFTLFWGVLEFEFFLTPSLVKTQIESLRNSLVKTQIAHGLMISVSFLPSIVCPKNLPRWTLPRWIIQWICLKSYRHHGWSHS